MNPMQHITARVARLLGNPGSAPKVPTRTEHVVGSGDAAMPNPALEAYREHGFTLVDGWGVDRELIELFINFDSFQTRHSVSGSLSEIGVHHGRTLILLGLLKKADERVTGIDLFETAQDQNLDDSGRGSQAALQRNITTHAPSVDFTLIEANSLDLAPDHLECLSGSRLFHIDGGHYIEVVSNDLHIAQTCLGPGGVIVVDDYWHSGFPEVQEAVHRYFQTSSQLKAVPFMVGKNKIFLAHLSHKDRLLQYMRGVLPAERSKRVRVLGHEAICCDPH